MGPRHRCMGPQPGNRRWVRAVSLFGALVMGVTALSIVPSSPVAAVGRGGVEVLAELPGSYRDWKVSADFTTAVSLNAGATQVEFLDVATGNVQKHELPESRTGGLISGVSADGSVVAMSGAWEGIVAEDVDGQLWDGFLLARDSGELTSITHTLDNASNVITALTDDASLALIVSSDVFSDSDDVLLWDDGTLAPAGLGAPVGSDQWSPFGHRLSADGSMILTVGRRGANSVGYAHNVANGTDQVVALSSAEWSTVLSGDGSTVVWEGEGAFTQEVAELGDARSTIMVWDTATTNVSVHQIPGYSSGGVVVSADGRAVTGSSFHFASNDGGYAEEFWQLDVESGVFEVLLSRTENEFGLGDLQLVASNNDGSQVLFRGIAGQFGSGVVWPINYNDAYEPVEYSLYLWDATGETGSIVASSLADQVARLYQAYFDRDPDTDGLSYWMGRRADGMSLSAVSSAFAASGEFQATYGSLDNGQFVDQIYRNVLGRPADAQGRTYWVGRLDGGEARGAIMVGFSESEEFVASTNTIVAQSIEEGIVARAYISFFGREATGQEADYWADRLRSGLTQGELADALSTAEFDARWGDTDVWAFLERATISILGRWPEDPAAYELHSQVETGQLSRGRYLMKLINQPSFVLATGSTPVGGLRR